MCRLYHNKTEGVYTRCCYRTGHKGLRLRGDHRGPNGHVLFGRRPRQKILRPIEPVRKCPRCGSPALSRHRPICRACELEDERNRPGAVIPPGPKSLGEGG